MKKIAWITLALLVFGGVAAEEGGKSAEALAILKKADSSIKAVESVSYKAKVVPSGVATNFAKPAEGEAYMMGWNGSTPEVWYSHVKSMSDGVTVEITGGGDGDTYYVIDHSNKKGYEDMDPGVLGTTGQGLQAIGMPEFVHPAPFDDELGAETIELLEEAEVNGETCHQVRVVYGGGQGESVWYFSKEDNLPRRRVRKFDFNGEGTIDLVVSNVKINPSFDEKLFKMALPKGYEQIDDFAP